MRAGGTAVVQATPSIRVGWGGGAEAGCGAVCGCRGQAGEYDGCLCAECAQACGGGGADIGLWLGKQRQQLGQDGGQPAQHTAATGSRWRGRVVAGHKDAGVGQGVGVTRVVVLRSRGAG